MSFVYICEVWLTFDSFVLLFYEIQTSSFAPVALQLLS